MNKREIIQRVNGKINPKDIKFLIRYGDWLGDDIDLLAVLERETKARLYEPSRLDILMIGKGEFERRRKLFDPIITDPIITGLLLSDDKTKKVEFSELRSNTILFLPVSAEAIQFLQQKAQQRLKNAFNRLEIYDQKGNKRNLSSALIHLSFACSYHEFANYYQSNPEFLPITFAHLLVEKGEPLLKEVMEFLRVVKSDREFSKNQAINLFQRTQNLLGVV